MTPSAALALYLATSAAAEPLAARLLARRAARGKEDPARLGERLGHPGQPRPAGPLVWLHAASVGEATSALPLIAALAEAGDRRLLLTTGTRSAAETVGPRLPQGALHAYAPVDTRAAVRRFLAHWGPSLAIWVESEIWPRLMVETARAGVPMALVNARISERSARGWGRVPAMARALFGRFRLVLAQDGESAQRIAALGPAGLTVETFGTLKSAVVPEADPAALDAARAALTARAVWLAASTHEGEEDALAEAVAQLPPETLLILAPRHPERGAAIAESLAARGLAIARRSQGETPKPATRIWLADTLGEMGLWYRLAPVAFVGGSWAARGGHTPFEPAALGTAILHGPRTENFAEAYAALAAAGGAREVAEPRALAAAVTALLAQPEARARMAAAAAEVRRRATPDLPALAARLRALEAG